jgi:ABC-2 type transport system permease protein
MRSLELAKRNFKEVWRDRTQMAFLLGMPLAFMLVFGFALGEGAINHIGPGGIVFALLILMPASATIMARDKEKGMMARLLTTPTKPWDFILGYSLPFIPILIVQIAILIGLGYLLGLRIEGNFALALLIFFLMGVSGIGLGMILGSFIKQEGHASIAWVLIIPMALISGAWGDFGGMPAFMDAIGKAFPSTYAIDSAIPVILGTAGFSDVTTELIALVGFAVGLFAVGALLFRVRMRV